MLHMTTIRDISHSPARDTNMPFASHDGQSQRLEDGSSRLEFEEGTWSLNEITEELTPTLSMDQSRL
jgi:hypothetical protein